MPKIGNPQLLFPSVRSFEDCHQISPKNYIRVGIQIHNLSMMSLLLLPQDLRTLPIRYNSFFYKISTLLPTPPFNFFKNYCIAHSFPQHQLFEGNLQIFCLNDVFFFLVMPIATFNIRTTHPDLMKDRSWGQTNSKFQWPGQETLSFGNSFVLLH